MKRAVWMVSMAALCGAALVACGGDDNTPVDAGTPDSGTPDAGTPDAGSFVAFGVRVNTPSGRVIYLNVTPNQFPAALPDGGNLDLSHATQFGNVDFAYALGNMYSYDRSSIAITEYTVNDAGVPAANAQTLSLLNTGIKTNTQLNSVFISDHHELSYTFGGGTSYVVDWDPGELLINSSIEREDLSGPSTMTTAADGGTVVTYTYNRFGSGGGWNFGSYVAFPISWYNSDFSAINPKTVVALVNPADITQPITYVTDTRCIGANAAFVDYATGDLYVSGTTQNGTFQIFPPGGNALPDACVLRIKAGTTVFDPSFKVDLLTATGAAAIYDTFYVGAETLLVIALDPTQPAPASASAFSGTAKWAPYLVNLDTGTGTRISDLPTTGVTQFSQYILDDKLFYQNYNQLQTTLADGGPQSANVTAYEVELDGGVVTDATIAGDLWDMGRMQAK